MRKGGELRTSVGQPTMSRKRVGGDLGDDILDGIKYVGHLAGEMDPAAGAVGVNPFDAGYNIGYNYIGPALDKAINGGKLRRKSIPTPNGNMVGGIPVPVRKGGSFIAPGETGKGLAETMHEKMARLRAMRKK